MGTFEKSMNLPRLDCSELRNPLVRQLIEKYNEYSQQGISCDRMRSHNKGSHSNHSKGGGGCYITSACLDAMGLPRDSLELIAMKVLTKEHILKSFQGKRDYLSYGRKGPAIVQAIESRNDSHGIWKQVYEKLKDITATILSNDYEKGHGQYKDLVLGLEEAYVNA